jgi:hypothetical protein
VDGDDSTVYDSYDIVSGSISNGIYMPGGNPVYYGKVYPKFATLIIDASMLNASASIGITQSSHPVSTTNNNSVFYNAIVAGNGFSARNIQTISSTYYFVRVKNAAYNYSTNPTYYSGSSGQLLFSDWINNPVSFITTVGLFDDSTNLLAVAKLSQPIQKNKSTEALIRVMLSF